MTCVWAVSGIAGADIAIIPTPLRLNLRDRRCGCAGSRRRGWSGRSSWRLHLDVQRSRFECVPVLVPSLSNDRMRPARKVQAGIDLS